MSLVAEFPVKMLTRSEARKQFESTNTSSITCLPTELITSCLLPYLSPFDIGRLRQVNRRFRNIIDEFLKTITVVDMETSWEQVTQAHDNQAELRQHHETFRLAFKFMTKNKTTLEKLYLRNCNWVQMSSLSEVVEKNTSLEVVDISNIFFNLHLSQRLFRSLTNCEQLQSLKMGRLACFRFGCRCREMEAVLEDQITNCVIEDNYYISGSASDD